MRQFHLGRINVPHGETLHIATLIHHVNTSSRVDRSALQCSKRYDAVIDFDLAIRDPEHPTRFLPTYNSRANLHPNDAGYKAMADAVDLLLFTR